jgi:phenylpyruvate tautomerase PptA (4-oxalocrotonate tautomerase family)
MGDHDAFIKIEAGMMTKAAFTVLIKQNDRDNWGVGGKIFSDILPTGAVDA